MLFKNTVAQNEAMQSYYVFQSTIYDATRWLFLFGRTSILDLLKFEETPKHILEIGCGTGFNLERLAKKYPNTKITGIDVSGDMLAKAQKKLAAYDNVALIEKAYGNEPMNLEAPDLVLFSYSLTMINPQYASIIEQAYKDLKPGGKVAVVDFHSTPNNWFKKHMENNHVRMEAQLDPELESKFTTELKKVNKAYLGTWNYFMYVGVKN